jgi:hypothetical protein
MFKCKIRHSRENKIYTVPGTCRFILYNIYIEIRPFTFNLPVLLLLQYEGTFYHAVYLFLKFHDLRFSSLYHTTTPFSFLRFPLQRF